MNEHIDGVRSQRVDDTKKTEETDIAAAQTSTPLQPKKITSFSLIMTLVALSLAVFCVALDNVIIVTAIPRITDDFHSVNDIGW